MELAVYYDTSYPSTWLAQHSLNICSYFLNKGFKKNNASELRSWMQAMVQNKQAHESCIIFSQDIVPETVFPQGTDCGNNLFRKYLDVGGRVVWLGDIPFWYRGISKTENDGNKSIIKTESWQFGTPMSILGAVSLIADSSSLNRWTNKVKNIMKSHWYSMRPIIIDKKVTPF